MCTLITSKGTDIDKNIANQNHATRTRTPKPGYLNLSNELHVHGQLSLSEIMIFNIIICSLIHTLSSQGVGPAGKVCLFYIHILVNS
jgi:hypothetical protein